MSKSAVCLVPALFLIIFSSSHSEGLFQQPDGTIYDADLNISWLENANLAASEKFGVAVEESDGRMRWDTATAFIAEMNARNYLGYRDWRLANMNRNGDEFVIYCTYDPDECTDNEYGHLFHQEGIASWAPDPFSNVMDDALVGYYWSSNEYLGSFAWWFNFSLGAQNVDSKQDESAKHYVWPVRDGPAPLTQDITTFADVTSDLVPDLAGLVFEDAGPPKIVVYSGQDGAMHSTIGYINSKWHGFGLATVRDGNQDGTGDDPAVSMLVINKTTRRIRVETRSLAAGSLISSIQFLNDNWRAVDVVVVDDLNGDGNTDDTAVAVLGERIFDGRIQLQLRDLETGALLSNTVYLNARWTPVGAAVADRSAVAPVGTLPPLIGVIAEKALDGRRVLQSRVAGAGTLDRNIRVLGWTWDYKDVSVNHDADGDGSNDDPVWLVFAVSSGDDVLRVQSRFVADGTFHDNIAILGDNWQGFRLDSAMDMGGGPSGELVISAIRRTDGMRRIHVKDLGTGQTTINIAP